MVCFNITFIYSSDSYTKNYIICGILKLLIKVLGKWCRKIDNCLPPCIFNPQYSRNLLNRQLKAMKAGNSSYSFPIFQQYLYINQHNIYIQSHLFTPWNEIWIHLNHTHEAVHSICISSSQSLTGYIEELKGKHSFWIHYLPVVSWCDLMKPKVNADEIENPIHSLTVWLHAYYKRCTLLCLPKIRLRIYVLIMFVPEIHKRIWCMKYFSRV